MVDLTKSTVVNNLVSFYSAGRQQYLGEAQGEENPPGNSAVSLFPDCSQGRGVFLFIWLQRAACKIFLNEGSELCPFAAEMWS